MKQKKQVLLSTILLCFSIGMAAQSVNMTNVTVKQALAQLQQNCGYSFVYEVNDLNTNKRVSVKADNCEEALAQLLHEQGVSYTMKGKTVIISKKSSPSNHTRSQQDGNKRNVKGIVKDTEGEPMIGVSIVIEGTSKGVITDLDGRFWIQDVPKEAKLKITYVGYKEQNIIPYGKDNLTIIMQENDQTLGELVVVGYGIVRKSDLTGAISSIGTDKLKERSGANVMSSLAGQIAGVQIQQVQGAPGSAPAIKIRGTSTITAGTNPLYVVDGYPIENFDISTLNPDDIAQMEVLKDASSAAIYGSRGANGVVMVTTKQGESGKTRVDANFEFGFQKAEHTIKMMDSQQFIQYYIDAHNNSWIAQGGKANDPNSVRPANYQIPEQFLNNPESFNTTDWQDILLRTAPTKQYQVAISGGSQNTKFRLSGSYLDQDGIIDRSFYRRFTFRSNVTHDINSHVTIGMNMAASYVNRRLYGTDGKADCVSLSQQSDPIFPIINERGTYGPTDPNSEWHQYQSYNLQLWHPYAVTREISKKDKTINGMINAYVQWNIIKGLHFKSSINGMISDRHYSDFRNEGQNYGWSGIQIAEGNANAYRTIDYLWENTLNYNHTFGKHTIGAMAGYTIQKNEYTTETMTSQGFPNNMVKTLNAGRPSAGATTEEDWSLLSYIGRVNYTYNDRYLVTTTLRRDGCSRFGKNNKWGYFPSISGAWKIKEERFLMDVDWLSSAKLRVSYGVTGNNLIENYGAIGLLSSNQYAFGTSVEPGLYPSTMSDPDLKWEKTGQFDVGVNIGLFNNRIYFEADYYNSITRDLLLNVPIPSITGFTTQLTNIGKVRNRGFEFLINTKNFIGTFKWDTNFNISLNRNRVLSLGPDNSPIYDTEWDVTTKTEVGKPVAQYYGYVFNGVYTSQVQIDATPHHPSTTVGDPIVVDVNNDKVIDDKDRTEIGHAQPSYQWGLSNTWSYKGIDLTITLNGSVGNKLVNNSYRYLGNYNGNRNGYADVNYYRSESQPGDGKHYKPYVSYPGLQSKFSNLWVEDASFMRIANIRLGYVFPKSLLAKTPFTAIRIYANIDNLHVFTHYKNGYDPEASTYTNALSTGKDFAAYPMARTITFGVKFTF